MLWIKFAFFLVLIRNANGNKPAVRVRVTQKGLNYAMEAVVSQAKRQMESKPIPDIKGQFLTSPYALTGLRIKNIKIPSKTLKAGANGLISAIRYVDFDLTGNLEYQMISWLPYRGGFSVKVRKMSIGIFTNVVANNGRLIVTNVTCGSKLDDSIIDVTGPHRWIFEMFKGYANRLVKSRIPKMACEQARKRIKMYLNEKFSEFPVKQNLTTPVTLDYSVIKDPDFNKGRADLYLKGEFQPSNGHMNWTHQPDELPVDSRRSRMMYVTIMDHLANSAGQAFFNQGLLRVVVSADQVPKRHRSFFNTNAFRNLPTIYGLTLIHSACPSCDMDIQMEATSPPQIETGYSGIKMAVQGIVRFKAAFPNNSRKTILVLAVNVTASATPKLNGTKLTTAISDLKITTRVLKPTVGAVVPVKIKSLEVLAKQEIEKRLEKSLSEFNIPLPLSGKFKLVNPKISYGKHYITLESDIQLM